MGVFDDVTVTWRDQSFKIDSSRVLGAISRVEDVITLKEMHDGYARRASISLSRVAQAYGSLLRYAGAQVEDDDVYASLFTGDADGRVVQQTLQALLMLLTPPVRGSAPTKGESPARS